MPHLSLTVQFEPSQYLPPFSIEVDEKDTIKKVFKTVKSSKEWTSARLHPTLNLQAVNISSEDYDKALKDLGLQNGGAITIKPGKMNIKLVVVGEAEARKTELLVAYRDGKAIGPDNYVPTVLDSTQVEKDIDGISFCANLWDTSGAEESEQLRPMFYTDTDVFIVAFSVVDRDTLSSVNIWVSEVERYRPTAPIILAGTNIDKLDEEVKDPVSRDEAEAKAKEIGAFSYVEISTKTFHGVNRVFEEAMKATMFLKGDSAKPKNIISLFKSKLKSSFG